MNESWKQFRIWAIVFACCMLTLGILMVIWPAISALAVCCIMGALCICAGITELIRYFRLGTSGIFFRFDLALGICSILIGLLLLIHPSDAIVFLPIAVGIYMIVESVFCIQLSAELHRFQNNGWWLALIWGIVGAVFAFLLLLNPFTGASVLMIFIGVSLIVGGVQSLYVMISISNAIKAGKMGYITTIEADSDKTE